MDIEKLKQATKAAREEFERLVDKTGLQTYPCRSGYVISSYGNEDVDIAAELDKVGLPYQRNYRGTYIVSRWPFEQQAAKEVYALDR